MLGDFGCDTQLSRIISAFVSLRGVISHSNGFGTAITPSKNPLSGWTGVPSAPILGLMSKAQSTRATLMYREYSATWLPGQMRRPAP